MGGPLKAILDTSIIIATDVERLEGELAISAITLAELHYGVIVAQEPSVRAERLRRLLIVQREFDALPVDHSVAASYGQVTSVVVQAGCKPRARALDLLIAATAHAHSARLYTRNGEDFRGLDELIEVVAV